MLSKRKGLGQTFTLALIALAVAFSGFGFAPRPASAALPEGELCIQYHIVQRGETLARIARLYGVDWRDMARINELEDPSLIYTGQRLCVKTGTADTTPPSTRSFSFDVIRVVKDKNVTLKVYNAPAYMLFDVTMDVRDTTAAGGYRVDRINTGKGGSFTISFDIPTALRGEARIAIRMESVSTARYYYTTFTNATGGQDEGRDTVLPRDVGERVDTASKRLHFGNPADLYRGNLGVSMPSSSYDGGLVMTRMDLNDTRRLEFIARGMDVQVNASRASENGKVRGLVYVYFNLDGEARELWRDGDLSIYRYDPGERAWVECPTSMVKSKNRPYGRLTCPITSFGIYGLAAAY